MKKIRPKNVSERLTSRQLYETSNLRPEDSGLEVNIWISSSGNAKHGRRIKVQRNYAVKFDIQNLFSVSINDTPEVVSGSQGEVTDDTLEKLFQFIIRNKETLLEHWNGDIDARDALNTIAKTEGLN